MKNGALTLLHTNAKSTFAKVFSVLLFVLTGCNPITISTETIEDETYTIEWRNFDDSVLEIDQDVLRGEWPSYDGDEPTRDRTSENTYSFLGWSPALSSVISNQIYTAQFTTSINEYSVTFRNYDSSVLEVDKVVYGRTAVYKGETPIRPDDDQYTYTFSSWDKSLDFIDEDCDRIAMYTPHEKYVERPLIAFIDDDGRDEVLTTLKPLFLSKNIPCGLAVFGRSAIIVDTTKRATTLELQNTYGWEILSHTFSHKALTTLTDEEVENECIQYFSTFGGYGFEVSEVVYPNGLTGDKEEIMSKYYRYGYLAGGQNVEHQYYREFNNAKNTNDFGLWRKSIGSYDSYTLKEHKDLIDLIKVNNGRLVYMTHAASTTVEGWQMLEDVIDYILEQDIEVVTPLEAAVSRYNPFAS